MVISHKRNNWLDYWCGLQSFFFHIIVEIYTKILNLQEQKALIYNHVLVKLYFHFLFLSSFSLSRITGAAGMLNHHSLNLLVHLSVLAFLGGEYLVKVSKNTSATMYLQGTKTRINAVNKRVTATFSLAWNQKTFNQTIVGSWMNWKQKVWSLLNGE